MSGSAASHPTPRSRWRLLLTAPAWLLALAALLAGGLVLLEAPPLATVLLVSGLALVVVLQLRVLPGVVLVLLGPVLGGFLIPVLTHYPLQLRSPWALVPGFLVLPARAFWYAIRHHRRLGRTGGQLLVVLASPRLLVVFVALVTCLMWWYSQPGLRARTWQHLGWSGLTSQALQGLDTPGEIIALLENRAGRLCHAPPMGELADWPWGACALDLPRLPSTEMEWWRLRDVQVRPAALDHPLGAAEYLAMYRMLEATWRRLAVRAPPAQAWVYPAYCWSGNPDYPRVPLELAGVAAMATRRAWGEPAPNHWTEHMLLGARLGHLPCMGRPGNAFCYLCGPITGPAQGVTEHEDGTLTWVRENGTEVRVPPVTWLRNTFTEAPDHPRPTMPPPGVTPGAR